MGGRHTHKRYAHVCIRAASTYRNGSRKRSLALLHRSSPAMAAGFEVNPPAVPCEMCTIACVRVRVFDVFVFVSVRVCVSCVPWGVFCCYFVGGSCPTSRAGYNTFSLLSKILARPRKDGDVISMAHHASRVPSAQFLIEPKWLPRRQSLDPISTINLGRVS